MRNPLNDLRRIASLLTAPFRSVDNEAAERSQLAVEELQTSKGLFGAEEIILNQLRPWLAGKKMLDIGVGTGRTVEFFAPLVDSYVGVDYAPRMIETCETNFGGRWSNARFSVADVRDLGEFEVGSFDLVLFSFNGIDCINHEDRLNALREIGRVCAPDGIFCFSSHNLNGLSLLYKLSNEERAGIKGRIRGTMRQVVLRSVNKPLRTLTSRDFAEVRDGALNFGIRNLYMKPAQLITDLRAAGFSIDEMYNFSGRSISPELVIENSDLIIYYVTRRTPAEPTDHS